MENGHLLAKLAGKLVHELGGEGDFRHQHHGTPALLQALVNELDIDLGLSAASNPVQQGGSGPLGLHQRPQTVHGLLLLVIQGHRGGSLGILHAHLRRAAEHLLLAQGEKPLFFQGPQRTHGGPSEITQLLGGHLSHLAQDFDRLVLEGRSPPPARYLG